MSSGLRLKWDESSIQATTNKLRGMSGSYLLGAMQRAGKEALKELLNSEPAYPPAPIGSRYQRTMALGESLSHMEGQAPGAMSRVQVSGSMVTTHYGTDLPYAKYVVYQATQAWMHRGRWWTVESHFASKMGTIIGLYRKYVTALWEK